MRLLHELVPQAAPIGVLLDAKFQSSFDAQSLEVHAAARNLGRDIRIARTSTQGDMEMALASFAEARVGGVLVAGSPTFLYNRTWLIEAVARYALPAIFENREFTRAGGLMSYGTNIPDVFRMLGLSTGRILKGEKPSDLPFQLPTKFDIAINLRTAKMLNLAVPTSILLRADEVIE